MKTSISLISNLIPIAEEHRDHLQACLKWQAAQGKGMTANGALWAFRGYNPLSEALMEVLVWLGKEPDAQDWKRMIRRINELWWEWYDQIRVHSPALLPFNLMTWLPRPDEFESNLERLRAKVLHVIPEGA